LIPEYDKIVIGSCLDAVLFAFNNSYPIFFTKPQRPFRFDHLDPGIDLSCLKIPACNKSLTTLGDPQSVGAPKEILWERLLFLLSLDGKAPLSNLCHSLRYDGNSMVCSNEYSKIMEFKFEQCYYFGDLDAAGLVQRKELDEDTYICYDHIAFNKGGKHEIDYLHTDDDFVSEIWFYGSDRIDGNTPVRDACAVSKLTASQLLDFNYSETMARFKTIHEMESRGMKGQFAGGYTTAGNPKHYKFRTTSIGRQTHQQRTEVEPVESHVAIPQESTQNLLSSLPSASVAYNRFLKYL
jgi:hypothetical protein